MATQQDTFDNSDNLSTLNSSEVVGGLLRSILNSRCVDLDGTSTSYIDLGSIDKDDALNITYHDGSSIQYTEFTIIVWVRFDPDLGYNTDLTVQFSRIIDKCTGSNSGNGYGLYTTVDGKVVMACASASYYPGNVQGRILAEDGLWHQLAFTCEQVPASNYNVYWTLYFDGKQFDQKAHLNMSQAAYRMPPYATAPMRFGNRQSNASQAFNGKLRGVYIHNAVLSPIEIAKTYYDNYHPSSSLIDFWDFSETSGSTVASNSGNFDGTLAADAAFFALPFTKPWSNTESNNIGALMSSPSSIDSFSYTIESQPIGKNARVQFSSDGSNWKSNTGSTVPAGVYQFDGVDDNINLSSGFSFGSSNWSFCCWFRSNHSIVRTFNDGLTGSDTRNSQYIAGNRNAQGGGLGSEDGWLVYIDQGNVLPIVTGIFENSGSYVMAQYRCDVLDGKWHHIAMTWDVDTQSVKLYIDGSITNDDLTTYTTVGSVYGDTSSNDTMFGRSPNNLIPFEGELCHPLVFTGGFLSPSEVANIYKYHQIPSANLSHEYLFNGNADDNIGSVNGTVTGASNYTGIDHIPSVGYSLKESEAYRFTDLESTGQEIFIPDADHLDFGTDSFTFAIDMFFDYPTNESTDGWHGLIRKSDTYTYNTITGFGLTLNGGGATEIGRRILTFSLGDGATKVDMTAGNIYFGPEQTRSSSTVRAYTPVERRWHRIVCVVNRSTNLMSLYVNGIKYDDDVSCSSVTGSVSNSNNLMFGENFRHWRGKLANATIWNEAKDQSFIQGELEDGYVDLTDSTLVGYWPLSGDADDKTSYANNGTVGSGSTDPISEIDLYRMSGTTPSQQTIDLSSLSLTDTVYYRVVTDTTHQQQYPISLSEVTFEYSTSGGGGDGGDGGDPITGPTTKTLSFASSNGDEEIIAAPDANKNIVLLGATSSVACVLKETDASGAVIAYIPAGHSKFKAPVKVTSGTAVHVQGASNITLFFTRINS